MAELIKTFREEVPAMRFIGKKYGGFGPHWGTWFQNGWFDLLESNMGGSDAILKLWKNGAGYVGLERRAEGQLFEYWIGMFCPENTPVPDEFAFVDFPAMGLGTCWIYGAEKEVHNTSACRGAVESAGMELYRDSNGGVWSFENCLCPRYTTPDEKGNIIMDYCYYVK